MITNMTFMLDLVDYRIIDALQRDGGLTNVELARTSDARFTVVYKGIIPDTFTDSVDVVVEGKLDGGNTFHATVLLAKCASRYENAPGKPGYTPGAKGEHPVDVPKGPVTAPRT